MKINSAIKKISFPQSNQKDWKSIFKEKVKNHKKSLIIIDFRNWYLTCKDIKYIKFLCGKESAEIISVQSTIAESIISASSYGLNAFLKLEEEIFEEEDKLELSISPQKKHNENEVEVLFHKGTLRSGETLEASQDILILGDVNPGAMVLAGGNIMIWGRLMGIAHAGKYGKNDAKISALELRPLQLRISNIIARGPEEKPDKGLAEEARLESGVIVIKPARSK